MIRIDDIELLNKNIETLEQIKRINSLGVVKEHIDVVTDFWQILPNNLNKMKRLNLRFVNDFKKAPDFIEKYWTVDEVYCLDKDEMDILNNEESILDADFLSYGFRRETGNECHLVVILEGHIKSTLYEAIRKHLKMVFDYVHLSSSANGVSLKPYESPNLVKPFLEELQMPWTANFLKHYGCKLYINNEQVEIADLSKIVNHTSEVVIKSDFAETELM